ncbi:hypothetical protein ACLOJK_012818 [Asimina triloba]
MAVRAVNGCSIFRSACSSPPSIPSLSALRLQRRCFHFRRLSCHSGPEAGISFSNSRFGNGPFSGGRIRFVFSLVEAVMEELEAMRNRKSTRSRSKRNKGTGEEMVKKGFRVLAVRSKELVEDKVEKRVLQKGNLLEFRKDSERLLLAVAQKPDGKKNWMVSDQNGVMSSIKPQQVTYIVPGVENFDHTDIANFIQKAQNLLDPSLLEFAWMELLEKNKSVTTEELAEIVYGSMEPLESYCAHILLSKDEIYFSVAESKGFCTVYEPRSTAQAFPVDVMPVTWCCHYQAFPVDVLPVKWCCHYQAFPADVMSIILKKEIMVLTLDCLATSQSAKKRVKEASEKELEEFVQLLKSAKSMPPHSKPPKCSWTMEEKVKDRIEALEAFAIDACKNDDQKRTAGLILKAMGLPKMSSAAINLLMGIGYFSVHVNLDLLKFNVRTEYSDEVLLAAENLLSCSPDLDKMNRKDLTFLKVYAIDVDEADELDDALSAERLQDGRIRVWIHVADPTSLVQPQSIIDREAMRRGTSIFLPTATFPMFPEKLAMEAMSLQQGNLCNAVSVSVILHPDGWYVAHIVDTIYIEHISEYTVDNSVIKPTYMLTYESASELLYLDLEEEAELKILSQAAALRFRWRCQQGAIDTATIEARVKVTNPDDPEPSINLYVEDQSAPAMRLVSEMMILCGEVIATFGSYNKIPLPYRGQPQSNISAFAFSHLPEGPVRSSAYVKIMRAAEMDFRRPIRHGILGIPGYVQFTSPIRRYMDLLAHYQVKAFLRGDSLPFSAGQLEGIASLVNMHVRVAKRISGSSLRYWQLEFLRRQPKERTFRAVILRFIKDRLAAILLMEVGIQGSAFASVGYKVGDEIRVTVEEAHPHDDDLSLQELKSKTFMDGLAKPICWPLLQVIQTMHLVIYTIYELSSCLSHDLNEAPFWGTAHILTIEESLDVEYCKPNPETSLLETTVADAGQPIQEGKRVTLFICTCTAERSWTRSTGDGEVGVQLGLIEPDLAHHTQYKLLTDHVKLSGRQTVSVRQDGQEHIPDLNTYAIEDGRINNSFFVPVMIPRYWSQITPFLYFWVKGHLVPCFACCFLALFRELYRYLN